MNASELIAAYRAAPESDRPELLKAAHEADATVVDAIVAWAAEAEGVANGDFWLFSDLADLLDDDLAKGHLKVAEAELRWMEGDSMQNVIDVAMEALGVAPDLTRPYEMVYELLRSSSDLVWEDAFERLEGRTLPTGALQLVRQMIQRGDARADGDPPFLPLAAREGATAEEAASFGAQGRGAEAIGARRAVYGEDFGTARAKVFG